MLMMPSPGVASEAVVVGVEAADLFPKLSKLLHVTSSGPPEVCKAKKKESRKEVTHSESL